MEERIITVSGRGGIHVVPDVTRLDLSLVSLHDSYEEAYVQAKADIDRLQQIMVELKLNASLPKTKHLDIEKKTHNEYDAHGHFVREVFLGFELDHRVKIDLGMDTVLLNQVVRLIGQRLKQAEINIGYMVKDPRPFQLKMLERAVKDAQEKAAIMAKACGCQLGKVKTIDYSVQELHIYSQARNLHCAEEAGCCDPSSLDITPEDLAASETVTVVWSLSDSEHKE